VRRRLLLLLGGVLGLVLVVVSWASFRATQVKGDLLQARVLADRVQLQLTAGDIDLAVAGLPPLRSALDRAAGRSHGPAWRLSSQVPVVGGNFRAVRRVALAAELLGKDALPEAAQALDVARRERVMADGRVDLAVLARIGGHVRVAELAAERARVLVDSPQPLLVPPVGAGLDQARTTVRRLADALESARSTLALAPGLLGQSRPRSYYVAIQNNAEARATGGLVAGFALLSTDRGRVILDHSGTDSEFHVAARPVPTDPEMADVYRSLGSDRAWHAANLTPHFPDAARNLAGMWQAQSGQRIEVVLAIDPIVMSELLRVTGPVRLADGLQVSADSVRDFVWREEYVRYPDPQARKLVLSGLSRDIFARVIATKDPVKLLQAFIRIGQSGHFFAWSADEREQAVLAAHSSGGVLPQTDVPYLSVLTQNIGGNKLDYYLRRTVRVRPADGGFLRVDVTLRNTTPLGLPDYVTVRSDRPDPPLPYGQAKSLFTIYGAMSSEISRVELDGKPAQMAFDRDHGHRMGTFVIEVPRGKDVTVSVLISQPSGQLQYRQQPLVRPDRLDVSGSRFLGEATGH